MPVSPAASEAGTQTQKPAPRRRRWLWRLLVLALILLIAGELVARFVLGLGDPPLLMADPQIEYLFRPSQDCQRNGNRIRYNAYSMRSEDFPARKTNPAELRVMVIGDSIINGGNPTDQSQLATTVLGPMLNSQLSRPVVVGNISAGSWGPGNQLAYVRKFGLFDADVVLVVVSSHDVSDVPEFGPLIGPTEKPFSALTEGLTRYSFGDLLHWIKGSPPAPASPAEAPPQTRPAQDRDRGLTDFRDLLATCRAAGARIAVLQHLELREVQQQPDEGYVLLRSAAEGLGVRCFDLGPAFKAEIARGASVYRDHIHPNAAGQRLLANAMRDAVMSLLADSPASQPASH